MFLHVGNQISVNTMHHHVFEMIIVDNCLMREAVETVCGGASLASTMDRGTRSPPVGVQPLEAEDLALIVSYPQPQIAVHVYHQLELTVGRLRSPQ